MKKTLIVVLVAAIIVLLGLMVYYVLFFYSNSALPPCCPLFTSQTEADQFEPGSGRDFGMMGPGMMGAMNVFVDSEYEFLVHMIPHHEEAVATATYLKENTEREEIREFAKGIIRTQSAEIEQMTTWLKNWYPDQQHSVDYQPMMRNLKNLEGDALDRAFMEDMIPHHMTAIMMSQQLLNRGLAEHEEVEILARSIRNSQGNEIQMMMRWLASWDNEDPIAVGRNLPVLVMGGLLIFLVFIVLVVLLVRLLFSTNKPHGLAAINSREILDKRYVTGEISREDYLVLRRTQNKSP
ncbi:MAG: DUF305 domain-containing protein [Bacillota bacterium]|nr:DUF305 domain-containing protein [Bacillota bacterium]